MAVFDLHGDSDELAGRYDDVLHKVVAISSGSPVDQRSRESNPLGPAAAPGPFIARLDSAYYNAAVIGAVRRADARFSVTVSMNANIRAAIAWLLPRPPQDGTVSAL